MLRRLVAALQVTTIFILISWAAVNARSYRGAESERLGETFFLLSTSSSTRLSSVLRQTDSRADYGSVLEEKDVRGYDADMVFIHFGVVFLLPFPNLSPAEAAFCLFLLRQSVLLPLPRLRATIAF